MRWNCSRTESNEALIHLSITGEREGERERWIQRGKDGVREKCETEEETKREKEDKISPSRDLCPLHTVQ